MKTQELYAKEWTPKVEEEKTAWNRSSRLFAALVCFALALLTMWTIANFSSGADAGLRAVIFIASATLTLSGINCLKGYFTNR